MYIPTSFKFEDDKLSFMKKYSFATLVTNKGDVPIATHLPFTIAERTDGVYLSAHLSAVNEQAQYLERGTSLVIFSEPHAYISPAHYDKKESVPTWDYISVHAYGQAQILEKEDAKRKALEEMIAFYEPGYLEQWDGLSEKYKAGMMKGIVAFEMRITDLQGQKKLSQNKSTVEKERILASLRQQGGMENDLADFIQGEMQDKSSASPTH
jgi:transcriptional regulator